MKTETISLFIIDPINVLRAEVGGFVFTRKERVAIETQLATLISERDAAEKLKVDASSTSSQTSMSDADQVLQGEGASVLSLPATARTGALVRHRTGLAEDVNIAMPVV